MSNSNEYLTTVTTHLSRLYSILILKLKEGVYNQEKESLRYTTFTFACENLSSLFIFSLFAFVVQKSFWNILKLKKILTKNILVVLFKFFWKEMNTFRYSYYGFMRCTRGRRATSCPYKAGQKYPRQSVCFCHSRSHKTFFLR